MKKKSVVILTVIFVFSILFSTNGYAKAVTKKINAVFGGYVIKLNGKTQKTEPISTGSKVYIPVAEIPKLTGASLKKSGNTYNILPVSNEQIKIMVRIMDQYRILNGKLERPYIISDFFDYSYADIRDKNSVVQLNETISKYNSFVKTYEQTQWEINDLVKSSAAKGYNMKADEANFAPIMSDFENTLFYLNIALDNLMDYYQTGKDHYDEYNKNLNTALDYSYKGRDKALKRYNYYLNVINNK